MDVDRQLFFFSSDPSQRVSFSGGTPTHGVPTVFSCSFLNRFFFLYISCGVRFDNCLGLLGVLGVVRACIRSFAVTSCFVDG